MLESEFWHMGGYGAYVWSSYGLALAVLAYNVIGPYLRLRRTERLIGREIAEDER